MGGGEDANPRAKSPRPRTARVCMFWRKCAQMGLCVSEIEITARTVAMLSADDTRAFGDGGGKLPRTRLNAVAKAPENDERE